MVFFMDAADNRQLLKVERLLDCYENKTAGRFD